MAEFAGHPRRNQDRLVDREALAHLPEDRAAGDGRTHRRHGPELHRRRIGPRCRRGAWVQEIGGLGQRTEEPVEHAADQAGSETDRQRSAPARRSVTDPQPSRVLIDLGRRDRPADPDDLAGKPPLADLDDVGE